MNSASLLMWQIISTLWNCLRFRLFSRFNLWNFIDQAKLFFLQQFFLAPAKYLHEISHWRVFFHWVNMHIILRSPSSFKQPIFIMLKDGNYLKAFRVLIFVDASMLASHSLAHLVWATIIAGIISFLLHFQLNTFQINNIKEWRR